MSDIRQLSPDTLLQQGIRFDQAGQHDAAAELYRQILERQPAKLFHRLIDARLVRLDPL